MSDTVMRAYYGALGAMQHTGPQPLHVLASAVGRDSGLADGSVLLGYLRAAGPEDALGARVHQALASWDAEPGADWAPGTSPNTAGRRATILDLLAVDDDTRALIDDRYPYAATDSPIVIADVWEEWRTEQRRNERDFYWDHYRQHLLDKGWSPTAVADVDIATEEVVQRLSDPTRKMAYQAKGLVVGYVQSGKTANFTGVLAKAVDAGYRLLIVLTGTTNMLRAQTQRRLDMELCGRENLEQEISSEDPSGHDYATDPDWTGDRFLRHGARPSDVDSPDIYRLSNHKWDYRRLRRGIAALEFSRRERNRPFHDPANLYSGDAKLVVAKKNSLVLKGLVEDLGRISARLGEVPVLIIDDESDQASVNTTSPAKWKADGKERTATNRLIGQLLRMMPRAQYVGYTATPYANVFIDPSDAEDLFPRDFLISLPRPAGYMGAEDFHDFDTDEPVDQRPLATSKERAHVRTLSDEPDNAELRTALDMYVLTGAVKCHRERLGVTRYRHHTMLVHEAKDRDIHRYAADTISALWRTGAYHTPAGLARLRELYEQDVLPVSRVLAPDLPTPADFDDLRVDIADALRRISPADNASPVLVVNSDPELERQQENLDFDQRDVWRILVGGNKLARGFTVEGLTVTYYRRATGQVDTLMQMGRWFGFRPRYRDLVRVYTTADLHDMFKAACRDEEFLRRELRQYADPGPGGPLITPRQVPPLIAQHRPDLRPTARNKMWNARLEERSTAGESMEPVAYPTTEGARRRNAERWRPVLAAAAAETVTLKVPWARTSYTAGVATLGHRDMVAVLRSLEWLAPETFQPELRWLAGLNSSQLDRWVVLLPYQARDTTQRTILGEGPLSIFERRRSTTGALNVVSESRHRNAAFLISRVDTVTTDPDPIAEQLSGDRTGTLLLYPAVVPQSLTGNQGGPIDPGQVSIAFCMVTPTSSAPKDGRLIKWVTVDSTNPAAVVVDAP